MNQEMILPRLRSHLQMVVPEMVLEDLWKNLDHQAVHLWPKCFPLDNALTGGFVGDTAESGNVLEDLWKNLEH